ncbi:HAD family hydrolase [Tsukamurella sp. 1534]|uniref:HAD family hydrolase n=1 Tax=Tsukamurella sp. 1534 TaxID=1151061 RepID=UPI000594A567|nr:HAD-IA family hydrolase [Tsukamurella sp. 1534]
MTGSQDFQGVLFDFSGTLFRLEEDPSWFDGFTDGEGNPIAGAAQAELMRRMTAPMGLPVPMEGEILAAWHGRDLSAENHRIAYHHVLEQSGVVDPGQRAELYGRVSNPDCWRIYPDTARVLRALRDEGLKVGVLSNIAYDIRPAFVREGIDGLVDAFVLSFEVGHMKPDAEVFRIATAALGLPPERVLMVGDSAEADGGATAIGCGFAQVEPLPVDERPDGLVAAVREAGAPA